MSASEWFIFFFNYSCTCMLTFKKLFLFLFFPLPWKLSFDSQAVLPAFLWLFTFCPLKRRPLWCVLGILAVQVQKKALLSNLFWHLRILAQSSAGLMGWLQMALSFSHCSPLCMRGTFCLFMWETLFFGHYSPKSRNKCYFIECLNVPLLVEVYLTKKKKSAQCWHVLPFCPSEYHVEMGGAVMELIVYSLTGLLESKQYDKNDFKD